MEVLRAWNAAVAEEALEAFRWQAAEVVAEHGGTLVELDGGGAVAAFTSAVSSGGRRAGVRKGRGSRAVCVRTARRVSVPVMLFTIYSKGAADGGRRLNAHEFQVAARWLRQMPMLPTACQKRLPCCLGPLAELPLRPP